MEGGLLYYFTRSENGSNGVFKNSMSDSSSVSALGLIIALSSLSQMSYMGQQMWRFLLIGRLEILTNGCRSLDKMGT